MQTSEAKPHEWFDFNVRIQFWQALLRTSESRHEAGISTVARDVRTSARSRQWFQIRFRGELRRTLTSDPDLFGRPTHSPISSPVDVARAHGPPNIRKRHQITAARAAPPSSGCNVWRDGSTRKYGVENKTVVDEG
jgi:hypothetical protein